MKTNSHIKYQVFKFFEAHVDATSTNLSDWLTCCVD